MIPRIDTTKIAGLGTVNADLDARYGEIGSSPRDEFDAKAKAWYYAECLKDARKKAWLTQQQVALAVVGPYLFLYLVLVVRDN